MNKILNIFKFCFPYAVIFIFIYLIYNYYQKNLNEFSFLSNIKIEYLITICFFCFLYLITEAFILLIIVKHFKKKIFIHKSFFVICVTYLFNTFLQFSGLGFRAYYLKRFLKINIFDFLVISILFIYVELLVFSFLGFIGITFVDFFNREVSLVNELKYILFSISFIMSFVLFFNKKIINFFINLNYFNKIKLIKKLHVFIYDKTNTNIFVSLKKVAFLYMSQFIILSVIFFIGYIILDKDNLLLLSIIASTFTDFSFIFTFTPYAIGISETFLYVSNYNFDLKISEILFLSNIFRLSMFVVYFPIGILYFLVFIGFKNDK